MALGTHIHSPVLSLALCGRNSASLVVARASALSDSLTDGEVQLIKHCSMEIAASYIRAIEREEGST